MKPEDLEEVVKATQVLKERQAAADSPEDVAKLPKLSLDDLEQQGREIPIAVADKSGVKFITHAVPSSGIVYADVCFDASSVSLEEAPLVPLLTACLLETGTSKQDRVALSQEIGTHTGGLRTMTLLSQKPTGPALVAPADALQAYVCVRGKAVVSKAEKLFELISQISTDANLDDQKRVIEMLKESVAGYRAGIPASGHTFADSRLRARYTAAAYVNELQGGIAAFEQSKALLREAETDWAGLSARLKALRAKLVASDGLIINLTGDEATLSAALPHAEAFASELPSTGGLASVAEWSRAPFGSSPKDEGLTVPTQVNYVAKGGYLYQPGEKVRTPQRTPQHEPRRTLRRTDSRARCTGRGRRPRRARAPPAVRHSPARIRACAPSPRPRLAAPHRRRCPAPPTWSPDTCARDIFGTRCA